MQHMAAHSYLAGKTAIISGGVFVALVLPLLASYPPLFSSSADVAQALLNATLLGTAFVFLGALALLPRVVLQVPAQARLGAFASTPAIAAVAWSRRQAAAAARADRVPAGFLADEFSGANVLFKTLEMMPILRETLDAIPALVTQSAMPAID